MTDDATMLHRRPAGQYQIVLTAFCWTHNLLGEEPLSSLMLEVLATYVEIPDLIQVAKRRKTEFSHRKPENSGAERNIVLEKK